VHFVLLKRVSEPRCVFNL